MKNLQTFKYQRLREMYNEKYKIPRKSEAGENPLGRNSFFGLKLPAKRIHLRQPNASSIQAPDPAANM
jgi:hypothetical protein